MKHLYKVQWLSASILFVSLSTQAHDPNEQIKENEQPDCTVMKSMDHTKMAKNDPVMQALMQQCMKDMHSEHGMDQGSHSVESGRMETEPSIPKHNHR